MVAPTAAAARSVLPPPTCGEAQGSVVQLFRSGNAAPATGLDLRACVRSVLQCRGFCTPATEAHLGRAQRSIRRYNASFQWLLAMLQEREVDVQRASVPELSSTLCDLAVCSASHRRNAYSALFFFPHPSSLRFDPVMKGLRKRWNHAAPKYGAFFGAVPFLRRLWVRHLNRSSISQVRDSLLIVWRLFQLYRSVDLEHSRRAVSEVNGKCYILVKRKGWTE